MFDISYRYYTHDDLPIYDINLQLLPNNGNDLGPGSSEYSLAKSTSPCEMLVRTAVDLSARPIVVLKFHNRLANADILFLLLSRPTSKQSRAYYYQSVDKCVEHILFIYLSIPRG